MSASLCGSSEQRRKAEPDARQLQRSRTPARRGRPGRFHRSGFRTVFVFSLRQYQSRMCLKRCSHCVGRAEQCGKFVCAPARPNVVGQATSHGLFGAVQLAGVAGVAQKKRRGIYHGTSAAHFHSSFGVVVAWAMGMWWRGVVVGGCMHVVGGCMHVIYACSYILVALISVILHFSSSF